MTLLSVVASMVLGLTIRVSAALWGAKIINSIMGNSTEGLTSRAMQQGGIGLLLSILIVSVPPMAAMFFQGTLGGFSRYSVFSGGAQRPGPQGQPPGSWGGGSLSNPGGSNTIKDTPHTTTGFAVRTPSHASASQADVKPGALQRDETLVAS